MKFTESLETVFNTLFRKGLFTKIKSETEKNRVVREIANFQTICDAYDYGSTVDLLKNKNSGRYTLEEFTCAIYKLREAAQELLKKSDLASPDRAEVTLFIDFLTDSFDLKDLFFIYG